MMACGTLAAVQARLRSQLLSGVLGVASMGCIALPEPKASDAQSSQAQTATLEGFIVEVDGQYTRGNGEPITLAPGCHIAKTTADALVAATAAVNVVWTQVPVVYFRVDAQPGHRYRIERSERKTERDYNIVVVVLRDIDPSGAIASTKELAAGPTGEHPIPTCP